MPFRGPPQGRHLVRTVMVGRRRTSKELDDGQVAIVDGEQRRRRCCRLVPHGACRTSPTPSP